MAERSSEKCRKRSNPGAGIDRDEIDVMADAFTLS
jgi:hypothetical protein